MKQSFTVLAAPPPILYGPAVVLPPDKTELRRRLRELRRRLAAEAPDAAQRAAAHLPLGKFPNLQWVAGYHALGSEMDPLPLCRRFADAGARLALPVAERPDAPLVFRAWSEGKLLVRDVMGVLSPSLQAAPALPDLVITPLLAFDRRGGRLGQGGGHYDRTLANLRARKQVFVLGLAYAGQEVEDLPLEPHDQRLDAILTETGYIEVG